MCVCIFLILHTQTWHMCAVYCPDDKFSWVCCVCVYVYISFNDLDGKHCSTDLPAQLVLIPRMSVSASL